MDTEILGKMFAPAFSDLDLLNLPKYQMYVKLMIDGIACDPFSAVSLEPVGVDGSGKTLEKIVRISRERYGTQHQAGENRIALERDGGDVFWGATHPFSLANSRTTVCATCQLVVMCCQSVPLWPILKNESDAKKSHHEPARANHT